MTFFSFAVFISTIFLTVSLFLGLYRLLTGPTLPDRIIVLDLFASVVMGFGLIYVVQTGKTVYLNVVVIIALLVFMSNIAFAKYLKKATS